MRMPQRPTSQRPTPETSSTATPTICSGSPTTYTPIPSCSSPSTMQRKRWPRPSSRLGCRCPSATTASIPPWSDEPDPGPLHVVVCAEYDALPGVGHACGHNIIAAAAVGAGAALAPVADDVGLTVTVLGTPAEEGGGGKILMLDQGAFEGAHAAMMVHPWPEDRLVPQCLAVDHIDVNYTGRSAHAVCGTARRGSTRRTLSRSRRSRSVMLRQQLVPGKPGTRDRDRGGDAANVVPSHAKGRFMIRARSSTSWLYCARGSSDASRPGHWLPARSSAIRTSPLPTRT